MLQYVSSANTRAIMQLSIRDMKELQHKDSNEQEARIQLENEKKSPQSVSVNIAQLNKVSVD